MIVVGLDVHKHALTAVAVDELGRALAERTSVWGAEILLHAAKRYSWISPPRRVGAQTRFLARTEV
jgi:hypothetical protein